MPELKSVYFCKDGTYFDDRTDAENYERNLDLADFIYISLNKELSIDECFTIASKITKSYTLYKK